MAGNSEEGRKFKRYDVDSIHGRMLVSSDINILNISMEGAAIATTQRLVMGRVYSLKLRFEEQLLTLKGKVVWSVLSHSRKSSSGEVLPVYKAGIRFTNTLTDEAEHLISYIEKNRSNSMEQRVLGVRFKLSKNDLSKIDIPCEYEIKRISQSGMLIETDTDFTCDSLHDMEINLDGTMLNVVGRIANVAEVRHENSVRFDIGIEFVSVGEDEMISLRSYIEARESGS